MWHMSYRCCSSGNVLVYYDLQLKGKSCGMSFKLYSLFTSKSKILKNYKNGESGLIYIYIICIIHPMMVNLNIEVNIIPAFRFKPMSRRKKCEQYETRGRNSKRFPRTWERNTVNTRRTLSEPGNHCSRVWLPRAIWSCSKKPRLRPVKYW